MNDMMNASVLRGYCDNGIINESFQKWPCCVYMLASGTIKTKGELEEHWRRKVQLIDRKGGLLLCLMIISWNHAYIKINKTKTT